MFVVILDWGGHSGFFPCPKAAFDLERIERGVSVVRVIITNNLPIASEVVPLCFAFQISTIWLVSINFAECFYICLTFNPVEALRSFRDADLGAVFVGGSWSNGEMVRHGLVLQRVPELATREPERLTAPVCGVSLADDFRLGFGLLDPVAEIENCSVKVSRRISLARDLSRYKKQILVAGVSVDPDPDLVKPEGRLERDSLK